MGKGIEFQTYGADTLKSRYQWMFRKWVVEQGQGGICLMTSANVEEHMCAISDRRFAG